MDTKIKAVAFDVDGTLIDSRVWKELHVLFGLPPEENTRLHMMYVDGVSSFHEVTNLMAEMYLKKTPKVTKEQADVVFKDFRFKPGVEETIRALSARFPLAVVSSGLTDYVQNVADAVGIQHVYSYTSFMYSDDGVFTGVAYNETANELQAKVNALSDFASKVGVQPEEVAFVGDSINDIEGFRFTGRGILVGEGTEALRAAAWKQVDALPEILEVL